MDERELRQTHFEIPIRQLSLGRRRAFPLYVYLTLNQHLVLRFPADYEITEAHIEKCRRKGVETLWCPRAHEAAWKKYVEADRSGEPDPGIAAGNAPNPIPVGSPRQTPREPLPSSLPDSSPALPEPPVASDPIVIPGSPHSPASELVTGGTPLEPAPVTRIRARTEESALAIEVLQSPDLSIDEKRTLLSEISTQLLGCLTAITPADPHPEATLQAVRKCQVFTDDIIRIAVQSHKMASIFDDIGMISETHIEHSTAVAAFAVIFALGVGYSERELLADLAFGAFLHDVGTLMLEPSLHQAPLESHTPEQRTQYARHVALGLEFLRQNGIELTPAVRTIIEQHHERFDGNGYPRGLQGFQLDELAQIVTLADLLHDLMQGVLDGRTRTPDEALNRIEKMQSSELFPTYFSPELFASVMQMIRAARQNSRERPPRSETPSRARELAIQGGQDG